MANKKRNKKQASALLPDPPRCAVCGKPCTETCPGCGCPVHNGCQPKHDRQGWQGGGGGWGGQKGLQAETRLQRW